MDSSRSAFRALLAVAAVVVVLAGLQAARTVLLPFLFAAVLAIMMLPLVMWMERNRLPRAVAIIAAVLTVLSVLVLVASFTAQSIQEFGGRLPIYQQALTGTFDELLRWLAERGVDFWALNLQDSFDPGSVMSVVGTTLNGVLEILSNTILVTITMAFMLAEASAFPDKLARAFPEGTDSDGEIGGWSALVTSVQRYLLLKAMTSGLTGVLVWFLLTALGVESPILWGFFAFVMNFIPTIGSIIAAVPAVLLALILIGPWVAAMTAAGYLVINVGIGNVLEPRVMGGQLGLSPMVVFLSLVFWGWMWGPAGMLLSVPLTVVIRSIMAHRPETAWLATLLGPNQRA
ncbi:MAG: AI-2E family transporter [Myxococcota bacterium]|nr:AI-2E family transporter [Myxococcota bacterium]